MSVPTSRETAESKPGTRKQTGARDRDQGDLQRDLELGLQQIVAGIRIIDRELELPDGSLVDFLARDAQGRLVLLLVLDEQRDHGLLSCLDALAFAQTNLELLARHMEADDLRTDLAPHLILIAATFDAGFLERVRPFLGDALMLLEVREIKSARGQASYFTPAACPQAHCTGSQAHGAGSQADPVAANQRSSKAPDARVEAHPPAKAPEQRSVHDSRADTERFLAGMPSPERELASLLVGRLRRLDPALDARNGARGLQWSHAGRPLGTLLLGPARQGEARALSTHLSGSESSRALVVGRDVDDFIEGVQERYMRVERTRRGAAGGALAAQRSAQPFAQDARARTEHSTIEAGPDDDFDEEDLPEFEMQPRDPGMILSPEEIEAFQ